MNKQELRDLYPRGTRVRNTLNHRTGTVTTIASDYGFSPAHLRIQITYDDAKKDRRGLPMPSWVKWENLALDHSPTDETLAALITPAPPPTVIISVYGGIAEVESCPPGVDVVIRDYDECSHGSDDVPDYCRDFEV